MSYYCNGCGEEFEIPQSLTANGVITDICPECYDTQIEEVEDEPEYCNMCSGTGISSSGRVDDSCSTCGGSGVKQAERDYDPDYD